MKNINHDIVNYTYVDFLVLQPLIKHITILKFLGLAKNSSRPSLEISNMTSLLIKSASEILQINVSRISLTLVSRFEHGVIVKGARCN